MPLSSCCFYLFPLCGKKEIDSRPVEYQIFNQAQLVGEDGKDFGCCQLPPSSPHVSIRVSLWSRFPDFQNSLLQRLGEVKGRSNNTHVLLAVVVLLLFLVQDWSLDILYSLRHNPKIFYLTLPFCFPFTAVTRVGEKKFFFLEEIL